MNSVILVGEIVDIIRKPTSLGEQVWIILLVKDEKNERISVKVHPKLADHLHEGLKISVEGRLKTDSYTNKAGQKIYNTYVYSERVNFFGDGELEVLVHGESKKEKNKVDVKIDRQLK